MFYALFAMLVGCVVLAGWLFHLPVLTGGLPGLVTVKANVGLGFVLAGAALGLLGPQAIGRARRGIGWTLAAGVLILGLLTLGEYHFNWHLGLDQFLFRDPLIEVGKVAPGRMPEEAAAAFAFLGVALLALDWEPWRGFRPAEAMALVMVGLMGLAGVEYALNRAIAYPFYQGTRMALPGLLTFTALAIGVLWARPERGLMGFFRRRLPNPLERRVYGALLFGLLALASVSSVSFLTARDSGRRSDLVDQLQQGRRQFLRVLSAEQDVETGERGYALTGDPAYLQPYDQAQGTSERLIQDIARQFQTEPSLLEGLGALAEACRRRQEYARAVVALRQGGDVQGTLRLVATGEGKRRMDHLRDLLAHLDAEAKQILLQRSREEHASMVRLKVILLISGALGLLVAGLATVIIHRDFALRSEAERIIFEQQALLEQRVRERTAQLNLERSKLAAVFENMDIGLVISNAQGGEMTMNPAALRLLGFASEEEMHRRLEDYALEWELRDAEGRLLPFEAWPLARAVRGEWVSNLEVHFQSLTSSQAWTASLTTKPVRDERGEVLLLVLSMLDVTKRLQAEQGLRDLNATLEQRVAERTRQLEEANRAKSEFLANMSHELRTPLNSIIGFSEMMKDGLLGDLNPKQHSHLEDIYGAGSHLLSLINDILDLSKVEAGALQLEAHPLDVAKVLEGSTLVVRERAEASGIRLEVQVDPGLGTLLADERKLKQILYNLLSNAVKFTPRGGAVTLRGRRCTRADVTLDPALPGRLLPLPPSDASDFLAITVADTGMGIAEGDLARLFLPFTQVDGSLARRHTGTGLGLSLVYRLAELHGGTVGVTSRPGQGTTFTVWLPLLGRAPGPLAEAPVRLVSPPRSAPLALVVEDDEAVAGQIAQALHGEGFETLQVATAEEGLVQAGMHRPDLITLDIFLPLMDGWSFLSRLKEDARLAGTSVVIITASQDLDRALALGARRVLQKPFTQAELLETLAGLLDRARTPEGPRVLVVDDNPKAVELLASALEPAGYRVLRAYGGAEAIETARRTHPDLVLLDLLMPGVSGFEVAQALRGSSLTAGIPIVVVTAKTLTPEDRARLTDGLTTILQKTAFAPEDLLEEVRRALPRPARNQEVGHGQNPGD